MNQTKTIESETPLLDNLIPKSLWEKYQGRERFRKREVVLKNRIRPSSTSMFHNASMIVKLSALCNVIESLDSWFIAELKSIKSEAMKTIGFIPPPLTSAYSLPKSILKV